MVREVLRSGTDFFKCEICDYKVYIKSENGVNKNFLIKRLHEKTKTHIDNKKKITKLNELIKNELNLTDEEFNEMTIDDKKQTRHDFINVNGSITNKILDNF